jgi:nucleoside-diphosphate-sugar epimerase
MRVAVTGASGNVGPFVVNELLAHGHDVVGVDIRTPPTPLAAPFVHGDVEDTASLERAFAGCDAVVHLAAIAEEGILPPDATFRLNAQGTMNAVEAAVRAGARRFVHASSEAVLGFSYRTRELVPLYFPLDEEHPLQPQDSYGLSKLAGEEICRAYARKGLLTTISLRPCYCWSLALPGNEAVESIANPDSHYRSLWVYIHSRDVARAYRLACEVEGIENDSMYVVAPDVRADAPTAELIARHYPGVPLARPLAEHGSLISGDKARRVLGFTPELSWRDEVSPEQLPHED